MTKKTSEKRPASNSDLEADMARKPEVIKASYRGSDKLKGKIALITGGDSGIGRAIAVHYAREGASVAIVYQRDEQEDAAKTQGMVEEAGQQCLLLPGDLQNKAFCKKVVSRTIAELGGLNILINNAAEQHPKDELDEIDDQQIESTFDTNIFSFFRVTRAALPHLQAGDCIINTTSVTSYRGSEHLLDYSATKGAITAFTRSLAVNLADKGIRVNGVAPGPIWTPLIPSTFDAARVAKFGKDVPLGRPGQPSEVAPAYVFLASEDATYITGQIIHINGGDFINT